MSVPSPALVRAVDTRGEPSPDVSQLRHTHMARVASATMRIACGSGVQVRTGASAAAMVASPRNYRPPAAVCAAYDALRGRRYACRHKGRFRTPSSQGGSVARFGRTP